MTTVFRLLYEIPTFTYAVMYAVAALLAWFRGGKWERLGIGAYILNSALSWPVQDHQNIMGPQYGFVVLDAATFLAFVAIALLSRLWWASWAAGFLLFAVLLHVAMIVDGEVVYAYYMGLGLCNYLITGAIVVGTLARRPPARSREAPKP